MFDRALAELHVGRKSTHWMWFIFPQLVGLGRSDISRRYGIHGIDEAKAYLNHPVLGPRLIASTKLVAEIKVDIEAVFGSLDAQKLQSSMTLFHRAEPSEQLFRLVLNRFFSGMPDSGTDALL